MDAMRRVLRGSRSSVVSLDSENSQQQQHQEHHSSSSSLANVLKDGVGNIEDSVTKKWLSWMLKRHVSNQSGTASTSDSNSFVDGALKIFKDLVKSHNLEILKIADEECVYQRKCLFFTLNAQVEFSSTELRGILSFNRSGNASFTLDEDWLTMDTLLVADKITVSTHCRASLLDVGPSFDLTADVDKVNVKLKLRINVTELQVILSCLEVTEIGPMVVSNGGSVIYSNFDVECEDIYPLDSVAAAVSRLLIRRCRDNIIRFVEFEASCHVETILKHLDMPELIKTYAKSCVRNATDAVKNSLPNLSIA